MRLIIKKFLLFCFIKNLLLKMAYAKLIVLMVLIVLYGSHL